MNSKNIAISNFRIFFIFIILAHLPLKADLKGLNANNDQGFWFEQFFTKDLPCNWSGTLHLQQRWGNDYRTLWDLRSEAIFQYNLSPILNLQRDSLFSKISIGPGYRGANILQKDKMGIYHWVFSNVIFLESNFASEFHEWKLRQRLRLNYVSYPRSDYRFRDHGFVRYLIGVTSPWKFTCWNINPYTSYEWFFRKNSWSLAQPYKLVGVFHLYEFRVGFNADLVPDSITTTLYWQLRGIKKPPTTHPRWFKTYQLALAINVAF